MNALLIAAVLLLAALCGLVAYVALRVRHAFRNLSQARLALYQDHLGELHETWYNLRRNQRLPKTDPRMDARVNLLASFPTMRASSEVYEGFLTYSKRVRAQAGAAQIAAAEQAVETSLVKLNVSMRDDLALNFGAGRFPSAEAFRRRRGQGGAPS